MSKKTKKGFTLIEALAGVLILAILIFGVYGMYDYSLKMVREKSRREEAVAVANEEMEYFRSIDYENLGTAATICTPDPENCNVSSVKNVVRNGINYTVLTDISYVNDTFDNADQDPEGDDETGLNDYKTARIEVRWDSTFSNNSVTLVSTFAPIGIEKECGGGVLKVNVVDENLQPVPQAGVYIKNDNIGYEYDTITNNEGKLRKICLPEDLNNNYQITINKPPGAEDERPFYKNAYSIAQTCPTGTGTPNPICPKPSSDNIVPDLQHVNINEGETTEITFFIDRLSTLNITTMTQNLPNQWTVNDNSGDGTTQNMPAMDIGPNNTYYFAWQDDRSGQNKIYGQKDNVSKIAQWGGDVEITESDDRLTPDIAVTSGGDAYVAWYHGGMGNQEIYIDMLSSDDGSSMWAGGYKFGVWSLNQSDDQSNPKINLNGEEDFYYLTFLDNSNDSNNDIYATKIMAGSISQAWWNPSELKVNDDMSGNTQTAQYTVVDPDTNDLYVVWQDNRWGTNDIWAQKISQIGTFAKEIKISVENDISEADTTDLNGTSVGIFSLGAFSWDANNLYYYDPSSIVANDAFLFFDEGNGVYDGTEEIKISVESDTDADTTMFNNVRFDGSFSYMDPDPETSNDAYASSYLYHDIYYEEIIIGLEGDDDPDTTYLNRGSDLFDGSVNYYDPDPEINNDSYLYVDNNGDGARDDWGQNVLISQNYSGEQTDPAMAISQEGAGKFLYFVWSDNYENGDYDILMAKFDTNGIPVWDHAINLTTEDTTSSDQMTPAIAINQNNNAIYVAWQDSRNGNPDIYMQKFNTSGEAQWIDDFRIENDLKINNDQTDSSQEEPQLAINSLDEVIVTWQDSEAGDYDIRSAIVTDPDPAPEGDVSLRIYGSKTIGKDAEGNNIYKFDSTFTTDSNGELKFDGSEQPKLEWDSYTIAPNGYNLLLANPSNPISIDSNTDNSVVLVVSDEHIFSFGEPVDYTTGQGPNFNAIGQLNSDNYNDMVVSNTSAGTFSVFMNNGDGTFADKVDYDTGGTPMQGVISDFNNDGNNDVAITNWSHNYVSIFTNNGDGTFAPKVDYAIGDCSSFIDAGDVNGDNKNDLIIDNACESIVSILINNGDGTFAAGVSYDTGAYPKSIKIGKINNDIYNDFALVNSSSSTMSVYINNGDGTFAPRIDYVANDAPSSIAIGDLNGDGKNDLATSGGVQDTVAVYLNTGDGTFAEKIDYISGITPRWINIEDIDGDDKNDLVVINDMAYKEAVGGVYSYGPDEYSGGTISIFINDGYGSFAPMFDIQIEGPAHISVGDLNNDDKNDLAVLRWSETDSSTVLSILINN